MILDGPKAIASLAIIGMSLVPFGIGFGLQALGLKRLGGTVEQVGVIIGTAGALVGLLATREPRTARSK